MQKITSAVLLIAILIFTTGAYLFVPNRAIAASLTSMSDVMTRQKATTASDHTFLLTTPSGVAEGSTVVITFEATFDASSIVEDDVDIADDGVELTTAANCAGSEKASVAVSTPAITITLCAGDGGAIGAGSVIRVKVGTVATSSGTGANQVINATSSGSKAITLAAGADTGTIAVPIVATADEAVVITATVAPSITFSNNDAAIGFGTLSTSAATWATANAAGSASDTTAHTMVVVTNATSGYTLTYSGATLTSGLNTITPITAGITNDADGTPGSEQFAISGTMTGTGSMVSGYDNSGVADWKFVAGTTTTLASHTAPTSSDSIAMHYLANIAGTTETGSYTDTITYIVTGNF